MVFLRIFITLFIVFPFFSCNNEDKDTQPSVSLASVEVLEGNTNNDLEITLSLTNVVDYDLSVDVRTVDGTATLSRSAIMNCSSAICAVASCKPTLSGEKNT